MIKDNNSCQFATCSVIFIKSRLMNISNIMVLTQHSKDNEPASKRKKNEVTGRCGSVHPSLGTLIPEPVGYPQLPGNDRKHFNNAPLLALTRQLKCAPFRYESFAPVVGGCCSDCPGFLPRLPTSGEATRSEPIFMLRQVENLDQEQEALVDWAVLQLQGSEGKCQRTRLGVKDFSTQVKSVA